MPKKKIIKSNKKNLLFIFQNLILKNIKKWNRTHVKLLIFLSIIGFLLRIEPIIYDDVIFTYDQGVDISYVRQLVVDRKLSLISRFTGLQGVFMGPFWTWFLAIPYVISGGNPSANVFFLTIFGIAAIWFTYAIIRKMLSQTVALISAAYVALSPPFLAAAHIVLTPVPLTILMIFYIWFLWQIIEYDNDKYWTPLGFIAGLFFQFEIGFAIFLFPATLIALVLFGKTKNAISKAGLKGLIFFTLPFLPQIIFDFRHNFLISKAIMGFFTGENTSLGSQQANFIARLSIRLGSLYEDYSAATTFVHDSLITMLLISLPALLGWKMIIDKKQKKKIKFALLLITLTIGIYIGFAIYPGPVWVWYRAGMPIVFILLISIGWDELIHKKKSWKYVAVIVFISLAFFGIKPNKLLRRALGKDEGGVASVRNQKHALDIIFQDAKDQPFDLYVYTPPVYTYVWDHMLYWYAENKYQNFPINYGYMPAENTSDYFYLLIEPDNIPVRIAGWKGNYVSRGEKIKAWLLSGDIKVEKWKAKETVQP